MYREEIWLNLGDQAVVPQASDICTEIWKVNRWKGVIAFQEGGPAYEKALWENHGRWEEPKIPFCLAHRDLGGKYLKLTQYTLPSFISSGPC